MNKIYAIIFLILFSGCALFNPRTDVVYVPEGDLVKLRETVKDVKVWIKTAENIKLPGHTDLLEGWY